MAIHDQGWGERKVFGKIRFMNFKGCKRKFDTDAFIMRYVDGYEKPTKARVKSVAKPKAKVPAGGKRSAATDGNKKASKSKKTTKE
jgi:deoxyribodipyrimidine photo-lyase